MLDATLLATYVAAGFVFSIIPGASVSVVVANTLSGGLRAGFLSILGTELAVLSKVLIVALGLRAVMLVVGTAFFWIKLAGAAYLIWLGWRIFSDRGGYKLAEGQPPVAARKYVLQAALVSWSNPKTLLSLGAFLPQFADVSRPAFWQILVLGFIVMAVATFTDGLYALLASSARQALSGMRLRAINKVAGILFMIGDGWLAAQKSGS